MKKNKITYIGIFLITLTLISLCIIYITYLYKYIKLPNCFIYEKFKIYCIGCGATRAVYSLLEGNILKSIYYNPFVLYLIIIDTWYLITEGISLIFKWKNKFFIKNIKLYIYIGLIILITNWIIKTIMLLNGYQM